MRIGLGIIAGVAAWLIFGQKLTTSHVINFDAPGALQFPGGDPAKAGQIF